MPSSTLVSPPSWEHPPIPTACCDSVSAIRRPTVSHVGPVRWSCINTHVHSWLTRAVLLHSSDTAIYLSTYPAASQWHGKGNTATATQKHSDGYTAVKLLGVSHKVLRTDPSEPPFTQTLPPASPSQNRSVTPREHERPGAKRWKLAPLEALVLEVLRWASERRMGLSGESFVRTCV